MGLPQRWSFGILSTLTIEYLKLEKKKLVVKKKLSEFDIFLGIRAKECPHRVPENKILVTAESQNNLTAIKILINQI